MTMFKDCIFAVRFLLLISVTYSARQQDYKYRTLHSGETVRCVPIQCQQNEEPVLCIVSGGRDACNPCPNGRVNPQIINTRGLNSYGQKPFCKDPRVFCGEEIPPEAHVVNSVECMKTGVPVVECARPKYIGRDIFDCQRASVTCTGVDEEITLDGKCKPCEKGFSKSQPGPDICVRNLTQSIIDNKDPGAIDVKPNSTANSTDSERPSVELLLELKIFAGVMGFALFSTVIGLIMYKVCKGRQCNAKYHPTEDGPKKEVVTEEALSLNDAKDDISRHVEEGGHLFSRPDAEHTLDDDRGETEPFLDNNADHPPDQPESVDVMAGAAPIRISTRTLEPSDNGRSDSSLAEPGGHPRSEDNSRRSSLSPSLQDQPSLPAVGHTDRFTSASLMDRMNRDIDDQTSVAEQPSASRSRQTGSVRHSGMSQGHQPTAPSEDSGIGTELTLGSAPRLSSFPPVQPCAVVQPYTPEVEQAQHSFTSAPELQLNSLLSPEVSEPGSMTNGPSSRTYLKVPNDEGVHVEGEESDDEQETMMKE